MNKPIQSYYSIKERYDKGLPIHGKNLVDSGILNYNVVLTCLRRLGFLKKIKNGKCYLKELSNIELMAFSDEYSKYKGEINERKNEEENDQSKKESNKDFVSNSENLKYFPIGGIENYKDDEILAELKKRGYEGELFLTVKQKINF
jgi:hypothetical protein